MVYDYQLYAEWSLFRRHRKRQRLFFIMVGILHNLKLKAVMLTGEVCSHDIPEVAKMISKKLIDYGMRCMSICIAVTIFILSAQSKLPIPKTVSFHGLDKLLHACAFGSLAFTLSYWFAADKWLTKPFRYFVVVCLITACYGISDEIHQIFVPGRDASIYDWFADCVGAVLAVCLRLKIVNIRSVSLLFEGTRMNTTIIEKKS